MDVNSLDDDGLASYFKAIQTEEVIEHVFTVKGSKGRGKENKKFQNAESVGKLQSRKKPPDKKSDQCGDWDIGERKTSP